MLAVEVDNVPYVNVDLLSHTYLGLFDDDFSISSHSNINHIYLSYKSGLMQLNIHLFFVLENER